VTKIVNHHIFLAHSCILKAKTNLPTYGVDQNIFSLLQFLVTFTVFEFRKNRFKI